MITKYQPRILFCTNCNVQTCNYFYTISCRLNNTLNYFQQLTQRTAGTSRLHDLTPKLSDVNKGKRAQSNRKGWR
jgi:hypothetical protein